MLDDNASRVSELQNLVHELLHKQQQPPVLNTLNEALIYFNRKLHDRVCPHMSQRCALEEALAYYITSYQNFNYMLK